MCGALTQHLRHFHRESVTAQIVLLEKAVRLAPSLGHEATLDRALDAVDRIRSKQAAPSSEAHSPPPPWTPSDPAGGSPRPPPPPSSAPHFGKSSSGGADRPHSSPSGTAGAGGWDAPASPTGSTSSRYSDGSQSAGVQNTVASPRHWHSHHMSTGNRRHTLLSRCSAASDRARDGHHSIVLVTGATPKREAGGPERRWGPGTGWGRQPGGRTEREPIRWWWSLNATGQWKHPCSARKWPAVPCMMTNIKAPLELLGPLLQSSWRFSRGSAGLRWASWCSST